LHILIETLITTEAEMKNFAGLHTNRKGITGNTNAFKKQGIRRKTSTSLIFRKAKHRGTEISSSQYSLPSIMS
jgi:hypothetical protein